MEDAFDPYTEWLAVAAGPRPPDHYVLLGLAAGQSDPQVIARAADMQMAKVRRIRPGPRLADWGRLLDQLTAAGACLSDPASKAAYDASLRSPLPDRETTPSPALATFSHDPATADTPAVPTPQTWQSAPTPLGVEPLAEMPWAGDALSAEPAVRAAEPTAASTGATGLLPADAASRFFKAFVTGMLVLLLLAGGVALYGILNRPAKPVTLERSNQGRDDSQPASAAHPSFEVPPAKPSPLTPPVEPSQLPGPPMETRLPQARPPTASRQPLPDAHRGDAGSTQERPEPRDPQPPKSVEESPPATEDPAKRAALSKAVSEARRCMAARDLAAARKQLQTAAANVQSPADESRVTRLEAMAQNLDAFWTSIRNALPELEPGSELELANTRVAVVESSPDELVVKDAGRLRKFTIETIPAGVVVAIAEQRFVSDANWRMLLGTFLAVDPDGNRARARQLWREAAQGGIKVDDLLPELDAAASQQGEALHSSK